MASDHACSQHTDLHGFLLARELLVLHAILQHNKFWNTARADGNQSHDDTVAVDLTQE
jgi:hypothetical protein